MISGVFIILISLPLAFLCILFYFRTMELNVLCKFFCKCKCYNYTVLFISLYILYTFTFLFLYIAPTIILIFYLYPVHTIIRLPFILNSILYTNSVLALLIYQCERCCYRCKFYTLLINLCNLKFLCFDLWIFYKTRFETCCYRGKFCTLLNKIFRGDKDPFYEKLYRKLESDYQSKTIRFGYIILQPVVTIVLLSTLMLFIIIVYGLLNMNLNQFTSDKSQVDNNYAIHTCTNSTPAYWLLVQTGSVL